MIKFLETAIKDSNNKRFKVRYSLGELINYPEGTITIYEKDYERFSQEIRDTFKVENNTDSQSDYFETDTIRVLPTHPRYSEILEVAKRRNEKLQKRWSK